MISGPIGNWDAMDRALDPSRLGASIEGHQRKALKRIGEKFRAMATKAIRDKRYESNSAITIALKGGKSTPLANSGLLSQSITYVIPEGTLDLWVGANRNAVHKDESGKTVSTANLVRILHDGASVDVQKYPKVRIALMARLREAAKKGNPGAKRIIAAMKLAAKASNRKAAQWSGYGKGKSIYVIPPRPFLLDVLKDPEFVAFVQAEIHGAMTRALMQEAA